LMEDGSAENRPMIRTNDSFWLFIKMLGGRITKMLCIGLPLHVSDA